MSSSTAPVHSLAWTGTRWPKGFSVFAWLVLAYNIPVILWGAYVRASYSGDGCGNHWPFCNGQVVPQGMKLATLIEYAHRMTTTLDTVLVVWLCVWAFLVFPKKHAVRLYAVLSLVFLLVEALLGAGLVLFRLVVRNQSAGRAWYLSAHLTNTLLLLAVLTATAWLARAGLPRLPLQRISGRVWIALGIAVLAGITGAIAALGDTLFPPSSLSLGWHSDVSSASPMLLRLRMIHPVAAIASACYLLFVADRAPRSPAAAAVAGMVVLQLAAGMVNLSLGAPVWMQLVHLLLADLLWIAVVLLALESVRTAEPPIALTTV